MLSEIAPIMSLTASVQRAMFCPTCSGILDVRRAVEVEVRVDGKLAFCKAFCGSCADARFKGDGEAVADIERRLTRLGEAFDKVEIVKIDGRTFTADQHSMARMAMGMH